LSNGQNGPQKGQLSTVTNQFSCLILLVINITKVNAMKEYLKLFFVAVLMGTLFFACQKDDPEGPPPAGESITSEFLASPGDQITFKGTFITESNFRKITLSNETLLLNKEIVFANTVSKYYLDYQFTILEETPFGIYIVNITAESVDGVSEVFPVTVNISSIPEATNITTYISASPGDEIEISGNITDQQGIASIALQNTGISLDTIIELGDNPLEHALLFMHNIPGDADQIVHQGSITINNISGRAVSYNLEVNLTGEAITYSEMYAAGGIQWWTWDAEHAYVMLPDPNDPNWFEIMVHAWPEEGFNEIKFIGQLAWDPNNWGLVDNSNPSAGMVNAEDSQPVILDAAGSSYYPAYFNVRFNPYNLEYSVEEVDQAGFTPQPTMYIVGAGFPGYPDLDWNPEEAIPMEQNPDGYGEHIFAIYGLEFSENVSLKFIGQNDGWGPVDVGFDTDYITDMDETTGGYQVQEPISWIPTKSGDGTADLKFVDQAGTYTILYDHFAKRAIIWKEE
jgi:hypothetical protein